MINARFELKQFRILRMAAVPACFVVCSLLIHGSPIKAANLLTTFLFDNNDTDATSNGITLGIVGGGTAPGFNAAGFKGQAREINGGQSLQSSLDAASDARPTVTIGAWAKPDVTTGDRAVWGMDNSGWDRNVLIRSNNWQASNHNLGPQNSGVAATTAWQFVAAGYGAAGGANTSTLYIDNATFGFNDGNTQSGDDLTIGSTHTGRSFDGLIDNFFVFDGQLSDGQILAIKNLALETELGYDPVQADMLLDLQDGTTSGAVMIDGKKWLTDSSAFLQSLVPGQVAPNGAGDRFFVNIDGVSGLASVIPEPSTFVMALLALGTLGLLRRRRTRR